MSETETALAYEGHVRYVAGEIVSLQCFESRPAECPQIEDEHGEPVNFPLDGYACESGYAHPPADQRKPDPVQWEVAFGPVETVNDADSAEAAATAAVAEAVFERDSKYHTGDPNPSVWVRRAGSGDPWQQVYEDPAAIEAAVAAIRVREYGDG
jgi:hypothetical protein